MTSRNPHRSAKQDRPIVQEDERLDRFSRYLQARGHRDSTRKAYLATANHFLHWLAIEPEYVRKINNETVQVFLQTHLPVCHCLHVGHRSLIMVRASLNQLLLMEGEPRARTIGDTASSHVEKSIQEFDLFLQQVCGLAEATRWYHCRHAKIFLNWLFHDRPLEFAEIGPHALVRFVTERANGHRPGSIGVLTYSLRSYLRFLAFQGKVPNSLATAIPRPPNWSLAGLPPSLNAGELERFWAAFDLTNPIGKRDFAMARCLFDLGLRCCEVAAMTLNAIDWHNGVLLLPKTKSRRGTALPIPESTGQALADYLHSGRPATDARAVFVHHRAPIGQAARGTTVRGAIRRAFARADLPWTGTHVLRHTMATQLLQAGASLKEIADILRHGSLNTTKLYTKVDLGQLFRMAMPWPRRAS